MFISNKIKTKNAWGLSSRIITAYNLETNLMIILVVTVIPKSESIPHFEEVKGYNRFKEHKLVANYFCLKLSSTLILAGAIESIVKTAAIRNNITTQAQFNEFLKDK